MSILRKVGLGAALVGGRQHTPCVYRHKVGEGGRGYIGGDGVCVCMGVR